MQFDGGDNNDGITILDVTEAQSPRYCFANLEDRMESNGGDSDENNGMIIKGTYDLSSSDNKSVLLIQALICDCSYSRNPKDSSRVLIQVAAHTSSIF